MRKRLGSWDPHGTAGKDFIKYLLAITAYLQATLPPENITIQLCTSMHALQDYTFL